jgi:recombination protein RecA
MVDAKATEDRQRAIGNAVSQIERQFGKGSIMRMGDEGNDIVLGLKPLPPLFVSHTCI